MRSRLPPDRPSSGTIALISVLVVCAVTIAWELRVVGPALSRRVQRQVAPAANRALILPRSRASRERPWHEHGAPGRDPVKAAFDRGVAAYNSDDAEAAADAFEEAVRLAPDEPEARINLGLVYLRLQRPEDAIRELTTGASLAKRGEGR